MDTSVLVSALRSRRGASFRLLSLADDLRIRLLISPALMFEYEALAKRQAAEFWADPSQVDAILDYICLIGEKPIIAYTWRPALPDPGDDYLLELGVSGGADAVVTHNTTDFRGANRFGLAILTPKEFLAKLEIQP
jgi:predicted nucleic acid-binding protein